MGQMRMYSRYSREAMALLGKQIKPGPAPGHRSAQQAHDGPGPPDSDGPRTPRAEGEQAAGSAAQPLPQNARNGWRQGSDKGARCNRFAREVVQMRIPRDPPAAVAAP